MLAVLNDSEGQLVRLGQSLAGVSKILALERNVSTILRQSCLAFRLELLFGGLVD